VGLRADGEDKDCERGNAGVSEAAVPIQAEGCAQVGKWRVFSGWKSCLGRWQKKRVCRQVDSEGFQRFAEPPPHFSITRKKRLIKNDVGLLGKRDFVS
jgi:hypothetical protein